jgi:hypothetical protein
MIAEGSAQPAYRPRKGRAGFAPRYREDINLKDATLKLVI